MFSHLIYYDKQFGFLDQEENILHIKFLVLSKLKTILFLFDLSREDLIEILSINKYIETILFSEDKIQNLYETENNFDFQKYIENTFMEKILDSTVLNLRLLEEPHLLKMKIKAILSSDEEISNENWKLLLQHSDIHETTPYSKNEHELVNDFYVENLELRMSRSTKSKEEFFNLIKENKNAIDVIINHDLQWPFKKFLANKLNLKS